PRHRREKGPRRRSGHRPRSAARVREGVLLRGLRAGGLVLRWRRTGDAVEPIEARVAVGLQAAAHLRGAERTLPLRDVLVVGGGGLGCAAPREALLDELEIFVVEQLDLVVDELV